MNYLQLNVSESGYLSVSTTPDVLEGKVQELLIQAPDTVRNVDITNRDLWIEVQRSYCGQIQRDMEKVIENRYVIDDVNPEGMELKIKLSWVMNGYDDLTTNEIGIQFGIASAEVHPVRLPTGQNPETRLFDKAFCSAIIAGDILSFYNVSGQKIVECNWDAEGMRAKAEEARELAEDAREAAENEREGAENARVLAETQRQNAEAERITAETKRVSEETEREKAETERSAAEAGRASAEQGRVLAEGERQTAEAGRAAMEQVREEIFAEQVASIESKASAATEAGGFEGGTGAAATSGAAVGLGASSTKGGGAAGNGASTGAGGAAGSGATSTSGGAAGNGAKATTGGAVGNKASTEGGGSAGSNAKSTTGGAAGYYAETKNGAAMGDSAQSVSGAALGSGAYAEGGAAVGSGAYTTDGVALGKEAYAMDADQDQGIDAIQLGTGHNSAPKTLQVYDKRIVEADGSLTDVGALSGLQTQEKGSIVAAVNEMVGAIGDIGAALDAINGEVLDIT